jgi:hypothetical protein
MDFVETVEPGGMAVSLSEDHAHRLWMLRRGRDVFSPLAYQLNNPLGRALFVELSPLLEDEVPNGMGGARTAAARMRPEGVEFSGFVSLFTKRTTDRAQLIGVKPSELNHADADAVLIRALDWLVDPVPRSKTHRLVLAHGRPAVPDGPLARLTEDRLDWLLDQAEGRGLRPMGWKSTGDKWPCTTAEYATKAGRFIWL